MKYHDVARLTCTNLMHGQLHIANIFRHTDGRWYFHHHGASQVCRPDGYATAQDAREAAIDAYEAGYAFGIGPTGGAIYAALTQQP